MFPMPHTVGIAVAHVMSVCTIGIATIALSNHLKHGEGAAWFGTNPAMALDTAIGMILSGLATFIVTSLVDRHLKHCHAKSLPTTSSEPSPSSGASS